MHGRDAFQSKNGLRDSADHYGGKPRGERLRKNGEGSAHGRPDDESAGDEKEDELGP